ncbi:MAG UNVERIFIED_CONTAM: hypothetical protein LVR18_51540 [Planctomycetaceae bacterium]
MGGILSGIGDIGGEVIVSSGAVLSPGSSPGLLSTGSLALETGSTYIVEIEGEVLGTSYDSVSVTGTVDLNNATLDVRFDAQLPDVTPNDGYEFIVINNDGTDPYRGPLRRSSRRCPGHRLSSPVAEKLAASRTTPVTATMCRSSSTRIAPVFAIPSSGNAELELRMIEETFQILINGAVKDTYVLDGIKRHDHRRSSWIITTFCD